MLEIKRTSLGPGSYSDKRWGLAFQFMNVSYVCFNGNLYSLDWCREFSDVLEVESIRTSINRFDQTD